MKNGGKKGQVFKQIESNENKASLDDIFEIKSNKTKSGKTLGKLNEK